MPMLVALLAIIILPMTLYYVGIATSAAAGTAVAAALLIFSRVEYVVRQDFSTLAFKVGHRMTPTVLVVSVLALIFAHAAIAWVYQPFDATHFAGSLVLLSLMVLAGCCVGQMLKDTNDKSLDRAIRCCFVFFCLSALCSVLGLEPASARPSPKPVFPFNEPSHFGITFTPFFIFCCIRARGFTRYGIWTIGLLVAASLENLTLVAGCGVAALAFVRGWTAIPLVLIALGAGTFVDLSYYLSRVDFASDNLNLSTLAYLQGWQLIGESLERSGGWGLGFQQLGLHGTYVPAAQLIYAMSGEPENLLDGAFNFAKVVSEFGVFGLLLIMVFMKFWLRSIRVLRRIASGDTRSSSEVFGLCVIAGYIIEVFVRGAGYFTGTGILLVSALWITTQQDQTLRESSAQIPSVGDGGNYR
jgi:hypothetical protein